MKRDNFSKPVALTLRDRANNFCSYPACGISTRSAHSDPQKSINTGIAAHICAASKNGPRYDSNMSTAERKDISNAIWLCSNHAALIDKDPKNHPVATLKLWKQQAENRVSENHGKPFLTQDEYKEKFKEDLLAHKENFLALIQVESSPSQELIAKLNAVENKLQNIEESYEEELNLRKNLEQTLTSFKNNLPEKILEHAQAKLIEGSTNEAQHLIKKVIDDNESNLTEAYFANGNILEREFDYKEAFIMYEKASVLSNYEPKIVSRAARLAYSIGKFDNALELLKKAGSALIGDFEGLVVFLNQQGLILRATANYPEAIKTFEKALNTLENQTSDKALELTRVTNSNLALVHIDKGDYSLSRAIYEKLIEEETQIYGEFSIELGTSLLMLGTVCEKEGKTADAEVFYNKAYKIYVDIYDEDHPETLTPLNNLAMIYISSNPKQAEKLLKKALKLRLRYQGEEHYKTAVVLGNLAACYSAQNNSLKAIKTYNRALTSTLNSFTEEHPEALRIKHNLALCLSDAGQDEKALRLMQTVAEKRSSVLGNGHPLTKLSLDCLNQLNTVNVPKNLEYILNSLSRPTIPRQSTPDN